ncbi:related to middle part of C.elegans myosin heavy chain A [Cephalotrichum gorgonifer]|uniref:Related to middle part of C.elegans myosin heavy chain A n=1 Tax=Cephalotrichum gorgonifer TaxID=2041049 RepID=A0AAE8MNU1_9PEZI|nr:related to middle part of C.elegans myosin heavy chain A [Cephalotrichum gorgonifer]
MATTLPRIGALPRTLISSRPSSRALCHFQARQSALIARHIDLPQQPLQSRAPIRLIRTTAPNRLGQHFDTLRFVQKLQDEGFTEEQAAALMKILNDVMEESMQTLSRSMVPREDAARATYTQKVDFAKLRSELLSDDDTEHNVTRSTYDRLNNDLTKLNSRLRDEINRTLASVRLDLNLEKGRIREEALGQELKMKETEARIDQEVANLREKLEQVKFQSLQWLIGVCTGFSALMLGAWRLFM